MEEHVNKEPLFMHNTETQKNAEEFKELKSFEFDGPVVPESDNTGVIAYTLTFANLSSLCGINCFNDRITKELKKEQEVLDLSFYGIGEKGALALSAALRYNFFITSLNLCGNYLYPRETMSIVNAIRDGRTIINVNLSENRLGEFNIRELENSTIRGGDVIAELLSPGSRIRTLELRNNYLSDEDVIIFASALADNTTLQSIDLGCNEIHYMGAVSLAKILCRNSDLREINLEWNKFSADGSIHLLSEGLLANNTVKSINLSGCGLNDNAAQLLARVIAENSIEVIYVANNHIGPLGAEVIAKGLKASSSLAKLILDSNPLSNAGSLSILKIIELSPPNTLDLISMNNCCCS